MTDELRAKVRSFFATEHVTLIRDFLRRHDEDALATLRGATDEKIVTAAQQVLYHNERFRSMFSPFVEEEEKHPLV